MKAPVKDQWTAFLNTLGAFGLGVAIPRARRMTMLRLSRCRAPRRLNLRPCVNVRRSASVKAQARSGCG